MGVATLGFDGGPSLRMRIDPSDIQWNFQIETASIETVGGRVVQVLGATLSDLRIIGGFGEDHAAKSDGGASWRLADAFAKKIREMMEYQSRGSTKTARALQSPAIFSYPPKGWKFAVTILGLDDPQGGSVNYSTGKFSHEYMLTLFIQKDLSTTTSGLGGSSSVLKARETAAVQSYLNRISRGFGWKKTEYNGPMSIDSPTATDPAALTGASQAGAGSGSTARSSGAEG